jgi:uncharacterized protein
MFARLIARTLGAAVIACVAFAPATRAQQKSSASAVAIASQILDLKGGIHAFDAALDGVILHHKGIFLQMNPGASKALNEIEVKMQAEAVKRQPELHTEVALAYAAQFTEQELKDILAFYKTPLGKKLLAGEPKAGEEAARRAQVWIDKYADDVSANMRAELKAKGFSEF